MIEQGRLEGAIRARRGGKRGAGSEDRSSLKHSLTEVAGLRGVPLWKLPTDVEALLRSAKVHPDGHGLCRHCPQRRWVWSDPLRFLGPIARRFERSARPDHEQSDLELLAYEALRDASSKWDPMRAGFRTFASTCVAKSLGAIVGHLVQKRKKSHSKTVQLTDEVAETLPSKATGTEAAAIQQVMLDKALRAVRKACGEEGVRLLLMRGCEDEDWKAIAAELGITVEQARYRYDQARVVALKAIQGKGGRS